MRPWAKWHPTRRERNDTNIFVWIKRARPFQYADAGAFCIQWDLRHTEPALANVAKSAADNVIKASREGVSPRLAPAVAVP